MHTDMATCMLKIRQFLTQTTEMDFKTLAFINSSYMKYFSKDESKKDGDESCWKISTCSEK